MAPPEDMSIDGRIQRSERSREAIVSALLALVEDGNFLPTAHQVAHEADVGVRTVFRHFNDMDSLFVAMNDRLTAEAASFLVEEEQLGPLNARLEALLTRRTAGFEKLAPYLRSSVIQRSRSEFVRAQHEINLKTFRRDLQLSLPEVHKAAPEIAAAIEMALSFEAFSRLRFDQKLSAKRTQEALRVLLSGLALHL